MSLEATPPHSAGENVDPLTVDGFGEEWAAFDQGAALSPDERAEIFEDYFGIFDFDALPADAEGFDLGCGSGRWAQVVAPRVGHLHCIDPSAQALDVARRNVGSAHNVSFHLAGVDAIPMEDGSQDFGYSLGVLHHVPDTAGGLARCVQKLKPGAPFLLYLYYAFDNRPAWFRTLWRASDAVRRVVSRLPFPLRLVVSQIVAFTIYVPLARAAAAGEGRGRDVSNWPLSYYRDRSIYTMRTDALDRLGTRLEQRFTRDEIRTMMGEAGLTGIRFSTGVPHWCAVGRRAGGPDSRDGD